MPGALVLDFEHVPTQLQIVTPHRLEVLCQPRHDGTEGYRGDLAADGLGDARQAQLPRVDEEDFGRVLLQELKGAARPWDGWRPRRRTG